MLLERRSELFAYKSRAYFTKILDRLAFIQALVGDGIPELYAEYFH